MKPRAAKNGDVSFSTFNVGVVTRVGSITCAADLRRVVHNHAKIS